MEEEYEPHSHRDIEHPTSNTETLIHLMKGIIGTGVLAMPEAFKYSGLVLGTIFMAGVGIISTHCKFLIIHGQYEICKKERVPVISYGDAMRLALGQGPPCFQPLAKCMGIYIDYSLNFYQLGVCCVYILFVAGNIKKVIDYHGPTLDLKLWLLTVTIFLIIVNLIRNLKFLVPISQVANVVLLVSLGIVSYYIFEGISIKGTSFTAQYVANPVTYPLFFSMVIFSFEAVAVILALESHMLTPKSFVGLFGILSIGMFIAVFIYWFIGFFGYMKFGERCTGGSINYILPDEDILAQGINITMGIAIFMSYPLNFFVPAKNLWENYFLDKFANTKCKILIEHIFRTVLIILTFLATLVIPNLQPLISLLGSLGMSTLGVIFPALMDICILWPNKFGPVRIMLWKNLLIILFGGFVLVTGVYTSTENIVKSFLHNSSQKN